MRTTLKNNVTDHATSARAQAHAFFAAKLANETDCRDVYATQDLPDRGFVLFDVRSREAFDRGHLPGATHMPYWTLNEASLATYPPDTLFVVYCAGTHCNASTRAALRLTELDRPVKEMIGGVMGWLDEGFALTTS